VVVQYPRNGLMGNSGQAGHVGYRRRPLGV
jgi:hypothetical protein